jgi:hypothetical protein
MYKKDAHKAAMDDAHWHRIRWNGWVLSLNPDGLFYFEK